MDRSGALEANTEATELVQPGERALHDPAVLAQTTAVSSPPTRDEGANTSMSEIATMGIGVVTSVGVHSIGTTARMSHSSSNGFDSVDQGEQLSHIV